MQCAFPPPPPLTGSVPARLNIQSNQMGRWMRDGGQASTTTTTINNRITSLHMPPRRLCLGAARTAQLGSIGLDVQQQHVWNAKITSGRERDDGPSRSTTY
jgi:hypothetical protein